MCKEVKCCEKYILGTKYASHVYLRKNYLLNVILNSYPYLVTQIVSSHKKVQLVSKMHFIPAIFLFSILVHSSMASYEFLCQDKVNNVVISNKASRFQ